MVQFEGSLLYAIISSRDQGGILNVCTPSPSPYLQNTIEARELEGRREVKTLLEASIIRSLLPGVMSELLKAVGICTAEEYVIESHLMTLTSSPHRFSFSLWGRHDHRNLHTTITKTRLEKPWTEEKHAP